MQIRLNKTNTAGIKKLAAESRRSACVEANIAVEEYLKRHDRRGGILASKPGKHTSK